MINKYITYLMVVFLLSCNAVNNINIYKGCKVLLNGRVKELSKDSTFQYLYLVKKGDIDFKRVIKDSNVNNSCLIFYKKSIALILINCDDIPIIKIEIRDSNMKLSKYLFTSNTHNLVQYSIKYGWIASQGYVEIDKKGSKYKFIKMLI